MTNSAQKNQGEIVVFRTSELPQELQALLPAEAEPHRCAFFFYGKPNPAVSALWKEVPEPAIGQVNEGMALAEAVAGLFTPHDRVVERLFPKSVPDYERTKFGFGFHSGDAEEVTAFLSSRAKLVSIQSLLDQVQVLRNPAPQLHVLADRTLHHAESKSPGLHTLETYRWPKGPVTVLGAKGCARFELSSKGQVLDLDLQVFTIEGFHDWFHIIRIDQIDTDGQRKAVEEQVFMDNAGYPLALGPHLGGGVHMVNNKEPGTITLTAREAKGEVTLPSKASILEVVIK